MDCIAGKIASAIESNVRALSEREAVYRKALEGAKKFVEAIMSFHGSGLQVYGWHLNGDPEPLDNFIEENLGAETEFEILKALALPAPLPSEPPKACPDCAGLKEENADKEKEILYLIELAYQGGKKGRAYRVKYEEAMGIVEAAREVDQNCPESFEESKTWTNEAHRKLHEKLSAFPDLSNPASKSAEEKP
jgi:hypothetical protein